MRSTGQVQGIPVVDARVRAILARHADWWRRKGMLCVEVAGTPLSDLWLPLSDGTLATEDLDLRPEMLDIDRLAGEPLEPGDLESEGDALCVRSAYERVPWVEAILGCPIRATITGGSMRTQAFIRDWDEWEATAPHWDDDWFALLVELTKLLVTRSGGRHAVTQTLMRGPSDLAEAVLGPELMCFSMFDNPRSLQRFLEEVTDTFIVILRALLECIPPISGGYVNPFGLWAPGTVARTQCDASAFLSPRQYAEWFLPYDQRISEAVDYAIIHLHSVSLHTVDPLLAVVRPRAIQVTLETSATAPSLQDMVPVFRRVLDHKPLLIDGPLTPDQVGYLQGELPHDGLCIRARQADW